MRVTKVHLLSMFRYYSCHTLFPLYYWAQSTQNSVLAVFLFSKFFMCTFILFRFTHVITTEITRLISNLLEKHFQNLQLEVTYCLFVMPKRAHVERENAIGILQANVTASVIAQQFWCHARMIERLRKRFWQIGTMSNRAHSWLHRLMTRHQDQ